MLTASQRAANSLQVPGATTEGFYQRPVATGKGGEGYAGAGLELGQQAQHEMLAGKCVTYVS